LIFSIGQGYRNENAPEEAFSVWLVISRRPLPDVFTALMQGSTRFQLLAFCLRQRDAVYAIFRAPSGVADTYFETVPLHIIRRRQAATALIRIILAEGRACSFVHFLPLYAEKTLPSLAASGMPFCAQRIPGVTSAL
jgi:hypothetical protein